ncbi:MAG: HYR domain-containing protein [Phycisphaerae bacterium]|nr:HYR domain-containing protein [Phycisphaerae bacterium]
MSNHGVGGVVCMTTLLSLGAFLSAHGGSAKSSFTSSAGLSAEASGLSRTGVPDVSAGRGAPAELIIAVQDPQPCYGAGNTVCFTLSMQNLPQPVTGFQAFLQYDPTQLTYQGALSSYTSSPFGLHVQGITTAEIAPGQLNLDGSIDFSIPQPPTNANSLLATLCFTVDAGNDGEVADLLQRVFGPFQTAVSFQGSPIPTTFIASGGILLDEALPTLTCPANQPLQCITELPAPLAPADPNLVIPSDNCASAAVVCNGTYSGSTAGATNDGSTSCGSSSFSPDVWYRFTPGSAGTLTVNTCGVGTNFDTVVSIHSASCPASPQTELACNNDSCGAASQVSAAVVAGTTYLIRVAGAGGATGSYELHVSGPECLAAADNCDPDPVVTWQGDVSDGNTCPETITRTYRVTDIGGNFAECQQLFVINDTIDPVIICPDVLNLDCATPLPPPANTVLAFQAQGGVVTDNCQVASLTMVSQELIRGTGCSASPFFYLRTYRAVDGCGNDRVCKQSIFQWDMFPPTITCPPNATIQCDESSAPANTGSATGTDNCGTPTITFSDATNLSGCLGTGTITRTWRSTDNCGQFVECVQTITVVDTEAPTLVCPSDISVDADTGCDGAVVTFADPAVTDNCDTSPTLVGCVPPSGSLFPIGTTTVTCTAQDDCGNIGTCTFDVTVSNVNNVTATVQLQGVAALSPISRCIKFIAKSGTSCAPPVHVLVNFTGNPATGTATFPVACGEWTELCAKDEQHTLFSTISLIDLGTHYQAAATQVLRGGDTDNDGDVDINDVTFLLFTFGGPEAAGGCPWNGNRGADFSNNGIVFSEDYTFITNNWLQITSCNCSAFAVGTTTEAALAPAVRISTRTLNADVAARADLNRDGFVDHLDVKLFEDARGLPNVLSNRMRHDGRAQSK